MALIPIWFGSKRALAARVKRIKDKEDGLTGDDLGSWLKNFRCGDSCFYIF